MKKVFISYHHDNDQWAKDSLQEWAEKFALFQDISVNTLEIQDDLPTDSTVTILLVGTETAGRKHVDWETFSSMRNSDLNKKSGIVVIQLPSTGGTNITAAHDKEKETIYPEHTSWTNIDKRSEFEARYPYLPARIIDNLLKPEAKVSVTTWEKITTDLNNLVTLIDCAHDDRLSCEYDFSRELRRANSAAK